MDELKIEAEADRRVALGAALLDGALPDWAQRIDLGKLDVSDTDTCVLGQLFAERNEERSLVGARFCDSNYKVGLTVLGLTGEVSVQHGFDKTVGQPRPNFTDLDKAWTRAVKARHDAGVL
ncbi:MAG TPA: hypothetical protein VGL75_09375 [Acidothermaceae bacterium]|jgi:hypothetical protein